MKLTSLIIENIDVYDFLKQNRGQIELDHGPQTYRTLQTSLMMDDEVYVRNWLIKNGYMDEEKLPFEEMYGMEEREDYVVVDKRNLRPLKMNYGGGQFYEKWSTEEKAQADANELNRAYQKTYGAVEGPHVVMYKSDYYSEKRKQGELTEKKKKKDPPLGKPKRGGSKAYYVYVRDPKTKRIKKVSFGSGGLRAKINDPKKRKAFAARHKCSQKTDRTKASYWSCRLPRYAKQLGLSVKNPGAFW